MRFNVHDSGDYRFKPLLTCMNILYYCKKMHSSAVSYITMNSKYGRSRARTVKPQLSPVLTWYMPRAWPLLNRSDTLSNCPAYFQACASAHCYLGPCHSKSASVFSLRHIVPHCMQWFAFHVSFDKLRISSFTSRPTNSEQAHEAPSPNSKHTRDISEPNPSSPLPFSTRIKWGMTIPRCFPSTRRGLHPPAIQFYCWGCLFVFHSSPAVRRPRLGRGAQDRHRWIRLPRKRYVAFFSCCCRRPPPGVTQCQSCSYWEAAILAIPATCINSEDTTKSDPRILLTDAPH
mmetsp:Transcript_131/g.204  ORF Transcript_131/g.204 Transcript_131/m.204 type:complete len:288 (-) Transcript_131:231-1094(-)